MTLNEKLVVSPTSQVMSMQRKLRLKSGPSEDNKVVLAHGHKSCPVAITFLSFMQIGQNLVTIICMRVEYPGNEKNC